MRAPNKEARPRRWELRSGVVPALQVSCPPSIAEERKVKAQTIPWYAMEVLKLVRFEDYWVNKEQAFLLERLASITTRWLAREVPHGTTKRRLKKLLNDAYGWNDRYHGTVD